MLTVNLSIYTQLESLHFYDHAGLAEEEVAVAVEVHSDNTVVDNRVIELVEVEAVDGLDMVDGQEWNTVDTVVEADNSIKIRFGFEDHAYIGRCVHRKPHGTHDKQSPETKA
jgi:hypothetical protein